jgi:uncharacterized membrane-anchored protein
MRPSLRLALIVALQTLALAAMVGMKQWTLAKGTPIVLETRPIDPRSLFRGDYVRLGYTIGCLDPAALEGDDEFQVHDRVHVLLRRDEPYWQPVSLHREPPVVADGHVAIKGEVENFYCNSSSAQIAVRYGIENYFVPEGEGLELERPRDGETVSILLAVDDRGNAGIKAVLVNGEVRYEERLF